jgi:hypothetical protein
MSKEIRQMIDKVKNFNQFINESIINTSNTNIDEIVNYIQTLPDKYKLKTKFGESFRLYNDGIDTALNNSMITHFWIKYHKNNKKTTTLLPIPNLNSEVYNKLNDLIKLCDFYSVEEDKSDKPKSLLNMSDNDRKSLNNRLLRANCFQMMNILLYEDYFDVDFRYGNGHKIIEDLILPSNEIEFYELFNEWNNKEGKMRHILFYADVIPIVSTIEKY